MKEKIDTFDMKLGERVKQLRYMQGLSQKAVANYLDISFQQVQKYEKGINRISVSTLQQLKNLFRVPLAAFFPDEDAVIEFNDYRENSKVIKSFQSIKSPKLRGTLIELLNILAMGREI